MAKVVVIGAGLGGLAAAARLATAGHRVTVCEQAASVGGKLGRAHIDGFRFDTGPSLLTMPWVFSELFRSTGGPLDEAVELVPVEPIARYRFADNSGFDSSADLERFCAELDGRLGAGNGDDWRRFTARAAAIWDAVRDPFLESPLDGIAGLARLGVRLRALPTIAPWQTLRGLGRQYLRDPRLRMFLDRYATYTGSDPRRAPAALATIPYVEQRFGGWYVRGGLYRLAEALARRAEERGSALRLSTAVTRVAVAGNRVTGVVLDGGERLPADIVVANADAAHLYADLLQGPAAGRARRDLGRTTPSLSGFVLLLALHGRTPDLAHHTVLFGEDYDAEFDALFGPEPRPVDDPTLYVVVPDDPGVAPGGSEAWFVLVNAPPQGQVDWTPALASAYGERLLDLLAVRGLDVRNRVVGSQLHSPADLAARTRTPGGAIYGPSSNGPRAAFLRPANRTPIRGLYLVGGSAHPGGGLPLVALSARIVADLIGPATV